MLLEVRLPERGEVFPLNLPLLRAEALELAPVTLLVGENGSGKSTLLEALAMACDLPSAGSAPLTTDATLAHLYPLRAVVDDAYPPRVLFPG